MATVHVKENGQIAIPKSIRALIAAETGDLMWIFADVKKGVALQKTKLFGRLVKNMALQFPKGKAIGTVKVGEKGQIVIPKNIRELFNIQPGDVLLMLADKKKGIALVEANEMFDEEEEE